MLLPEQKEQLHWFLGKRIMPLFMNDNSPSHENLKDLFPKTIGMFNTELPLGPDFKLVSKVGCFCNGEESNSFEESMYWWEKYLSDEKNTKPFLMSFEVVHTEDSKILFAVFIMEFIRYSNTNELMLEIRQNYVSLSTTFQ